MVSSKINVTWPYPIWFLSENSLPYKVRGLHIHIHHTLTHISIHLKLPRTVKKEVGFSKVKKTIIITTGKMKYESVSLDLLDLYIVLYY